MAAGFLTLSDQHIRPGVARGDGLVDGLDLADHLRPRRLDGGRVGRGIAERHQHGMGRMLQRDIKRRRCFGLGPRRQARERPGYKPDPDPRIAGFAELVGQEIHIAIAAADQPEPARFSDGCRQSAARDPRHGGEDDGMTDAQQLA